MKKYSPLQKKDSSVRPMRTCAVWDPFLKTSRQNVCVPLTAALTLMTITVIFLTRGTFYHPCQKEPECHLQRADLQHHGCGRAV